MAEASAHQSGRAGPASALEIQADQPDYSVNGPFLVMHTAGLLPARCIKCNRPTDCFVRKRMLWADTRQSAEGNSWLREVPGFCEFFAILSMVRWFSDLRTMRAPVVAIPLCPRHRRLNWLLTGLAWLALPAGVGIAFLPVDLLVKIWAPVLGLFISAIAWTRPRPVKAVHAGLGYVTLAGARRRFLQSIVGSSTLQSRDLTEVTASTQAWRDRVAARRAQSK